MHEFTPTHLTAPPTIGCLAAINASLWCVVADAQVGRGWKGGSGEDPDDDFTRAMALCEVPGAPITIAQGGGVVCTVGGCGMSYIWHTPKGLALLAYYTGDEVDEDTAETWDALASRAVDLASGTSTCCGELEVTSGCLVMMLPYVAGEYSQADIARAAKSSHSLHSDEEDQVLIPMPNGRYEVWVDELEFADELGEFETRVRIISAPPADAG